MPFDLPTDLLALGDRFHSFLPDPGQGWNPADPFLQPIGWADAMVKNGTLLVGQLARSVVPEIGWPEEAFPQLEAIGAIGLAFLQGEISLEDALTAVLQATDLLKAALTGVLADVQEAVTEIVGSISQAVPVIGWLVQLALFVRTSVVLATQRNMPEGQGRPFMFNYKRDQDAAQVILDVLRTRDWTSIWLPAGASWGKISLSYDPWGKVSGWAFGPGLSAGGMLAETEEATAISMTPGFIGNGAYFQGPVWGDALPSEKCLTNNKGCPQPASNLQPEVTRAMLAPSATQIAGLAWAFLQRPTGACCNVDLRAVELAWDEWQIQGSRFYDVLPGGNDPRDKAIRLMVRAALGYHGDLYPQKGVLVALQVKDAIKDMRAQIKKLLGTIAVAYVPKNAPALRDQELLARWTEMRALLLKHPARYEVDLEMAAAADELDGEQYAAELWHTRLAAAVDLAAPGLAPAGGGKRRALDGGPAPESPRLPKVPSRRGAAGGGAGLAIGVGAAVGIGALALALRGR